MKLAQDIATAILAALDRDKWPAVVVYDSEIGPADDVGPRGVVYLPAVDDLDEGGDE